jgi:flagellar basal-body rod protein FlgC
MSTFNAIGVAGTGVTVYRKWLDAVSDNIANMDNVSRTSDKAFQARYVIAQEAQDGNGIVTYDPDNPLADGEGYVRRPDIDLGGQMAQMMMAQRAYQANLSVVDRAKESYTAAINLGK